MSEMIERVAEAIFQRWVKDGEGEPLPLEEMTEGTQRMYRGSARAAIEAMREPPISMLEAGAEGSGEDSIYVARRVWDAMIDEALKP